MGLNLVSGPAETPVSLETAKQHVRVTGSSRDDLLTLYLEASVDAMEGFLGRSLIDQTWDLFLDEFPHDDGSIELLRPPLIELAGVFYTDDDDVEREMDAALYVIDASAAVPRLTLASGASWPTPRTAAKSVRLRYRAGYLDQGVSPAVANVPASIKAGVLLHVGDLYAHRETIVVGGDQPAELPGFIQQMVRRYRVNLGMA